MNRTDGSLSKRLRNAALERARLDGELVDSYVLDADGVIDLRVLDDDAVAAPASQPAAVLGQIRGHFGDAAEVDDLYVNQEWTKRRWPFS